MNAKQPNQVRGNRIGCINFQICPVCYGCRAYDSRDPECKICKEEGEMSKRNFNVCNTQIHESWKINNLISKNIIKIKNIEFKNGGN